MSREEEKAIEPRASASDDFMLPFERWAEVSASLLKRNRDERLDILEEYEIDPLDWGRVDRHWVTVLADDLERGDDERVDHYAKVCADELRGRERHTAKNVAPDEAVGAPEPPAAHLVEAPPAAPLPAPVPTNNPRTPDLPAMAVLPIPPPPVVTALPRLDVTAPLFDPPKLEPTLPFGDKPSLESAQQPSSSTSRSPGLSGETLPLQVNLKALALPFLKNRAADASGSAETAPLPAPYAAGTAPSMTLDAYASLCAELAAQPDRRIDVLRRYRVADEGILNALHAQWQRQFAAQPQMRAEWQTKYDAFRAWLAQRR